MQLEEQVASIFSVLFNKPVRAGDNFSMKTEKSWDSMKHIEVIMTVEEECGVSFNPKDIPKLTSLDKITQVLMDFG